VCRICDLAVVIARSDTPGLESCHDSSALWFWIFYSQLSILNSRLSNSCTLRSCQVICSCDASPFVKLSFEENAESWKARDLLAESSSLFTIMITFDDFAVS
jgi:hypothetical protein